MLPLPRDLERQLRKMGVKVEEIGGVRVVLIEAEDREILIEDPQVVVLTTKNQKIFQIVGSKVKEIPTSSSRAEAAAKPQYSEDDVKFVGEQTGLTADEARKLLEEAGGDIARALMIFEERRKGKQ